MDTKEQIVPILVFGSIGVFLISLLGKKLQESGGLVEEVGDAIIGSPPNARFRHIQPVTPRLPPDDTGAIDGGVVGNVISPRDGGVINRNNYFGSEFDIRLRFENVTSKHARRNVVIWAIEDDIFESRPTPYDLGYIDIPPQSAIECDATLFITTKVIVTWHLTVTLKVECDGISWGVTTFDVG